MRQILGGITLAATLLLVPTFAQTGPRAGSREKTANVESYWLKTLETIQDRLGKALEAYKNGDAQKAKELVVQAQFDGYKNTFMESVIRRHLSRKKNYEYDSTFTGLVRMIHNGESPEKIKTRISNMAKALKSDLAGLPLPEGVVSEKVSQTPAKDWPEVMNTLLAEIEKAIAVYADGHKKDAVKLVQNTYFDIFEASEMDVKIEGKDANFKARLDGHFNLMVRRMKDDLAVKDIQNILADMKVDFKKAADMLKTEGKFLADISLSSLLLAVGALFSISYWLILKRKTR